MAKLTTADLDRPLKCCNLTVREHCRETEGAWFLTPCTEMLVKQFPMLRDYVDSEGKCIACGKPLRAHFAFGVQQISVKMRATSEAVPIMPSGDIVVLEVLKTIGCPEDPPEFPAAPDE